MKEIIMALIMAALITTPAIEAPAEIEQEEIILDEDCIYNYYDGPVLTRENGRVQGPVGVETYYNLDMSGVVEIMRANGYTEEEYPYWIREDGCKMLGDYIMVAADQSLRPLGSIMETSRGLGIVCDTGSFIYEDPYQIDMAVNW